MNRVDQHLGLGVFEKESGGAGAQRGEHVLVQVEGGDHDHLDRVFGAGRGEQARGLQSVHPGHADVHQHDIRLAAGDQRDRFAPVPGLADDLEAWLVLE